MQQLARFALTVLMAVTLAACYEFPLDPVPQAALDPKLVGNWRCITSDAHDEAAGVMIGRARDGVYAVTFRERGEPPDRYEAHASVVSGHTLLHPNHSRQVVHPDTRVIVQ